MEATMDRLVRAGQIEHYRALLAETADDGRRQQLQTLLTEERRKRHALAQSALNRLWRTNVARLPGLFR
jgi:hypothetical protein